jgi:hypothetical protein
LSGLLSVGDGERFAFSAAQNVAFGTKRHFAAAQQTVAFGVKADIEKLGAGPARMLGPVVI